MTRIDTASVESLPGVLAILSHLNAPRLAYQPHKGTIDAATGERLHVLQGAKVRFFGQPVAVAVAETLDQAEHAAAFLRLEYEAHPLLVRMEEAEPVPLEAGLLPGALVMSDSNRGDAEAGGPRRR